MFCSEHINSISTGRLSQNQVVAENMDANTYTSIITPHIWWFIDFELLCSKNRQHGEGHEFTRLLAFNRDPINRDIHRTWGEDFFIGQRIFLIETRKSFT